MVIDKRIYRRNGIPDFYFLLCIKWMINVHLTGNGTHSLRCSGSLAANHIYYTIMSMFNYRQLHKVYYNIGQYSLYLWFCHEEVRGLPWG